MNFQRTPSGLSNMHLFLDVDAVVYVEGGSLSLSFKDVLAGKGEKFSTDIQFWQKMFEVFCPDQKFAFKAVGTKGTLLHIAAEIAAGNVANVCVAMDRDFDNLKGTLKIAPNIFYTLGYSWENDVWNEIIVESVFYTLCPVDKTKTPIRFQINQILNEFDQRIRWAIHGDVVLSFNNLSLIPRDKEGGLIGQKDGKPYINRVRILELIRKIKETRTISYFSKLSPIAYNRRNCCGHLVAIYCHQLLQSLFRNLCRMPSIHKNALNGVGIDKFFDKLQSGIFPECYLHYENQFKVSTIC